jgi:hypothetical protein
MTTTGLCLSCAVSVAAVLAELPPLWAELADRSAGPCCERHPLGALTAAAVSAAAGEPVSGSRDAPVPGRLDVLSFLGPSPYPGLPAGLVGLRTWVRAVCEGRRVTPPTPDAVAVFGFLGRHGDWVAAQPWAGGYATEVHSVAAAARSLAGSGPGRAEHMHGVACPRCDARTLFRSPGHDGRRCEPRAGGCGATMSEADYSRWLGLSAHVARGGVG